MRGFVSFILLAFMCYSASAQVPGYKGLKYMAGYNFTIAPNFLEITILDSDAPFRIRKSHAFVVSGVIGRKWTAGAEFSVARASGGHYEYDHLGNDIYAGVESASKTFGAVFSHYGGRKGALPAPVGKFTRYRIQYSSIVAEAGLGKIGINTRQGPSYGTFTFTPLDPIRLQSFGLGMGVGQSAVIFERAVLEYEVGVLGTLISSSDVSYAKGNAIYRDDLARTINGSYALNFKIGLTGLLF